MQGEAWLYLAAVLINAVNLFLQVFFTIMYSDLEWSVAHDAVARMKFAANHFAAITSTQSISAIGSTHTSSRKQVYTPS